jgi:hypothetical protein
VSAVLVNAGPAQDRGEPVAQLQPERRRLRRKQ